ncbi:bacterial DNA-binding factor [Treponema pallidum subsp. pallidum]|nr:bacterial DNA-binding factor [Treponema pallidum subsp. pallidum]
MFLVVKRVRRTRSFVVDALCDEVDLSRRHVARVVDSFVSVVTAALERGETVELRDFGVFESRVRKASVGKSIKTGEVVSIPSHCVVVFRPSKRLKSAVRGYRSGEVGAD